MLKIRLTPILLMLPFLALALIALLGQCILAYGADAPSLSEGILGLLGAIKDKAAVAVVLMHVFQILRTHEVFGILGKLGLSGKGLQVAVALLTTAGFVVDAYAKNANLASAIIEGLFTAGGAMLIYDAFKASSAGVATPLIAAAQPVEFPAAKKE